MKKKSVQIYDVATGELISWSESEMRTKNGSGFVISYTAKMNEFIEKTTAGSIVRVFVYLAHHQDYGNNVNRTFGYRSSHGNLQKLLNVDKKTLWRALDYLKENYLVHVMKIAGSYEFMVNPNYVSIGADKKSRMAEWNRRWAITQKEAAQNAKKN